MAERQSAHRQQLENRALTADIRRSYVGLAAAFVLALILFFCLGQSPDGTSAETVSKDCWGKIPSERDFAVSLKAMSFDNNTKARALACFRLGNSANRTAQIVGISPDTCERWRGDFDAAGLLRSNSEEIALKADALISDALDYIATQGPQEAAKRLVQLNIVSGTSRDKLIAYERARGPQPSERGPFVIFLGQLSQAPGIEQLEPPTIDAEPG